MPVLESTVERKICEWARENCVLAFKVDPTYFVGAPDRIFMIYGGRPVLMEIKKKGEQPRKIQRYVMSQLRSLGYDVCWVDNYKEGIAYLSNALDAAKRAVKSR